MKKYLKLIRIKHWIKNILIFLPWFCAKQFSFSSFGNLLLSFLSFSLIASVIYIINDICDIEKDKLHPTKKNRPLASGEIKKTSAIIICILFIILGITLNYFATASFINISFLYLILYFIINILYSMGLKNIAILDIILLASGFIIRVYYGASIIDVPVSNWLFLTIMNASIFLGLGKRQKELTTNKNVRKVLKDYDETFLENFMNISVTLVIVFYSLWTIEQESSTLYLSIPLLTIIFMQYMLYIKKSDEGDPTTVLFQNKGLILTVLLYCTFMFISLVVL